ncbi:hypothetical protein EON80_07545 [bacterium]|nr:MAG: hypothetical protein EON80_07545 [bacterium]
MKSPTPAALQPKWLYAAAVGALTMGAIVGANAQNSTEKLPAPPKLAGMTPLQADLNAQPGRDFDEGDDFDGQGRPPRPNGRGPMGPPPGDDFGPEDGDDVGPPGPPGQNGPPNGEGPDGFGPPRGGPGRGGPRPQNDDTAQGAEMALERSFHLAGEVAASGKLNQSASNIFAQAHTTYDRALAAYTAKSYKNAVALADVSEHLSHAALVLSRPEGPTGPAGWAAPPKVTATAAKQNPEEDRVAHDLNRAFRDLSQPLQSKDASVTRWLGTARDLYKEASTDFAGKRFDAARSNALASNELVQAARRLSDLENI